MQRDGLTLSLRLSPHPAGQQRATSFGEQQP
jgi:hypothetical protein